MNREEIRQTFEAYFEKYKKTEGDRTSWSAVWADYSTAGKFEINLTKCPRGTRFKLFADSRKLGEIEGWEALLEALPQLEKDHAGLFDTRSFFETMKEMV
ncbi:MAG: hypothetical protein KKB70_10055 [Proteobacteria bacterium]|nr:hypothetical protein [Pseudomonadota bacterium]MBU1610288.1 hypothetical protein [Pseudomonadota bacterium]